MGREDGDVMVGYDGGTGWWDVMMGDMMVDGMDLMMGRDDGQHGRDALGGVSCSLRS
jgi:hypothetical protein